MSVGHHTLFDDEVTDAVTARLKRLRQEYPELEHFVQEDRPIVHRFDIPWIAGRSKNGDRGYVSRTVELLRPLKLSSGTPVKAWIVYFLMIHEFTERWLMDNMRMPYEEAHHLATAAEKLALEAAGYRWDSYRSDLRTDIKADDKHQPERCPPDLDLEPYEESDSKSLLQKIHTAQKSGRKSAEQLFRGSNGGKTAKTVAEYQSTPKGVEHCSGCSMFLPPHSCSTVGGTISPKGWCRYWERKHKEESAA